MGIVLERFPGLSTEFLAIHSIGRVLAQDGPFSRVLRLIPQHSLLSGCQRNQGENHENADPDEARIDVFGHEISVRVRG